ncbi:MAG: ATP-binding protein [Candidatus Woesearchaeota archaeon]
MAFLEKLFGKKNKDYEFYVPFEVTKTDKGDYDDFRKRILAGSNIMLITGKRGSGKTALGMKFIEMFKKSTKKKIFTIGFESAKLPFGIKKAESIEAIRNNSVVLIDESAITFSSRESMKTPNKQLGKLMSIARHKNLSLILIAQNSGMVDLNVLRLADTIILKEPSLLQMQFERKAIKELYEKAGKHFKDLDGKKENKSYFYVMDDEFEGLLKYELPEFWNESISKSFKNY